MIFTCLFAASFFNLSLNGAPPTKTASAAVKCSSRFESEVRALYNCVGTIDTKSAST